MSTHKVFVYGTLRKNQEATHMLNGYCMFFVEGKVFNFPFIQNMGKKLLDETAVVGNLVEVDDEGLATLDKYEGVNKGLFSRVRVLVEQLDTSPDEYVAEEVWVYVAGPALAYPLIESGDWLNRGD